MVDHLDEPVHVVEYDLGWPSAAASLAVELLEQVPDGLVVAVEHIGSTAVPGLAGKPVVDLQVGVRGDSLRRVAVDALQDAGWVHLGEAGVPGRDYLRRRDAGQAANVHVMVHGCELWRDNIVLRDYLRRDRDARQRYAAAKRAAARRHPRLLAYSDDKSEVLVDLLREAAS